MKVDKAKVIDEVWDDTRVASFLKHQAPPDDGRTDPDYWLLLHAYQAMRPGDFARFLKLFASEGRNINALNDRQQTLLDYIGSHRLSGEFRELLEGAGARPHSVTQSGT